MIIFGTKESVVGNSDAHRQFCPLCQNKAVQVVHFKSYFHLYYIPMFPIKSRTAVGCHSCGVVSKDITEPNAPLAQLARNVPAPKTPKYMFAGLGVISLLMVIGVWAGSRPTSYDTVSGEKQKANGDWVGDKQNGPWEYFYDSGSKQADYNFRFGEFDGLQKIYYESGGLESEFEMSSSLRDGISTDYTEDGLKTEVITWVNGRKHGIYKYFNRSGIMVETGNYERDWKEGIWKTFHDNEQLASIGKYVDGEQDSIWVSYDEEGELLDKFEYKAGNLEKVFFVKGPNSIPQVKNGNGEVINYHENGQPSSIYPVKNYKYSGTWKTFHEDGKLQSEGTFDAEGDKLIETYVNDAGLKLVSNGKGKYVEYFAGNVKLVEGEYKNGREEGLWTYYYPTGTVMVTMEYKNGEQHGKHELYSMNGVIARTATWVEGRRTGPSKTYYEDGTIESSGQYENDKRVGKFELYSSNGKPKLVETYIKGEFVSSTHDVYGDKAKDIFKQR